MSKEEIQLTSHSIKRAKERLGWNKKSLYRMGFKAFNEGNKQSYYCGKIRRYLDKLGLKEYSKIRVYGQNVYFFNENRLCTLYRIPNDLVKYLKQ